MTPAIQDALRSARIDAGKVMDLYANELRSQGFADEDLATITLSPSIDVAPDEWVWIGEMGSDAKPSREVQDYARWKWMRAQNLRGEACAALLGLYLERAEKAAGHDALVGAKKQRSDAGKASGDASKEAAKETQKQVARIADRLLAAGERASGKAIAAQIPSISARTALNHWKTERAERAAKAAGESAL